MSKTKKSCYVWKPENIWEPIKLTPMEAHLCECEVRGPYKDNVEAIMRADEFNGVCQGCYHNPCTCTSDDWACDPE